MSRKSSLRNFYPRYRRTLGLVTFTVLAIVAFSYVAQARVQGATPPAHTGFAVPPGLIDDEWSGGPRECDLPNGISTSCVFMD